MNRTGKGQYPLQAVLRQHVLQRDQLARQVGDLERNVSDSRQHLEKTEHEVHVLEDRLDELEAQRVQRVSAGVDAREIHTSIAHEDLTRTNLDRAARRCEDARQRLERSRQDLEAARTELRGAMGQLKSVERHRDKWQAEEDRLDEQRAEEDP